MNHGKPVHIVIKLDFWDILPSVLINLETQNSWVHSGAGKTTKDICDK